MKYIKAQTVFPESLLAEIQRYIQEGGLVYIPKPAAKHKSWGTNTGAKDMFAQRNKDMVQAFKKGVSIVQLAEIHCLAEDTVKKIVYGKF